MFSIIVLYHPNIKCNEVLCEVMYVHVYRGVLQVQATGQAPWQVQTAAY